MNAQCGGINVITLEFGAIIKMSDPSGMKNRKPKKMSMIRILFILVSLRTPLYQISTSFCWQFGCATN